MTICCSIRYTADPQNTEFCTCKRKGANVSIVKMEKAILHFDFEDQQYNNTLLTFGDTYAHTRNVLHDILPN